MILIKNSFLTNFKILHTDDLVLFIIFVTESNWKSNEEKFLHYFKKKEKTSEDKEDIKITNTVSSVMKDTTNPELSFAAEKIKKSHCRPTLYQKQIPENAEREVGKHVSIFGTFSAIK